MANSQEFIGEADTDMEHSLHTFICLDSAAAFSFLQKHISTET